MVDSCKKDEPQPDPNDLVVPFFSSTITIDGVLDEPAWKVAAQIELRTADGRASPRYTTQVRLAWNLENLFFGFECQDPDIFSSYIQRDDPLYLQEAVEIFLDPDMDRQDYLEFEVSPANVLFDASFTGRRQGMNLAYNPTVRSAVKVNGTLNKRDDRDHGWTVELAIPFLGLTGRGRFPPVPGDRWRINLFRLDKSGTTEEASSWMPTAGDFHDLDAFGTIRFAR